MARAAPRRNRTVVLLSGGMDSLVLLAEAVAATDEVFPLFIDYGQVSMRQELNAALRVVNHYNRAFVYSPGVVRPLLVRSLPLKGVAWSKALGRTSGTSTFVPGRNIYFIAAAAAYAREVEADRIGLAFIRHVDGYAPGDQSETFLSAMDIAIGESFPGQRDRLPRLWAPFTRMSKMAVAKRGYAIGAPLDLAWTCYTRAKKQCGRCSHCLMLKRAVRSATVKEEGR